MHFYIFLIINLVVYFSKCERITKINWWWAKLKDDFLTDDAELKKFNNLSPRCIDNESDFFDSSWCLDKEISEDNLQGSYAVTKEIDGIYRCALTTYLSTKDILFQKNSELTSKWITLRRWRFYREDVEDSEMAFYENINLIFGGIDTFVELTFNKHDLHVDYNMFRPQIRDVKSYYRAPYSYIVLILIPTTSEAHSLYRHYSNSTKKKLHPECPPKSYNGDCHVYMVRKMQSSFGSIIGPTIPSMGISGPAYIEGYNETSIRHVLINIEEQEKSWLLNITVHFAKNTRKVLVGSIEFDILGQHSKDSVSTKPNVDGEYVHHRTMNIPKDMVKLWWPAGYGDQNLYDLNVKFISLKGEVSSRMIRVGFRTIELIEEKLKKGTSFYFKINGRPIFMKGTVLAPISLQPEVAQDKEKIKSILSLVISHNMNMIRIWGGGIYQTDIFYDLADEMGLLIWQDFMFIDFSYPVNEEYLKNVREEVKYQVRRLYNHPSIAIFCGNDEGELSIVENRYNQKNSNDTRDDYLTLFVKTIKKEFVEVTFGRGIFTTSTPSNGGLGTEIEVNPNSFTAGDAHYFNYKDDPFDHQTYPVPRFVSAYGVQSMPKTESFRKDTNNFMDMIVDSDFLNTRQHLPDGLDKMRQMIEHQFVLPPSNDWFNHSEAVIYYSQVIQAYAMRIQTEKYRSYRSVEEESGAGKTMGALYWHFNDVWTSSSWSGIDYYGQWKVLQYYVPKFFSPIIFTGQFSHNDLGKRTLQLFVVSDKTSLRNITARLKTGRWDSLGTNSETSMRISVDADSSKQIYTTGDIDVFFSRRNCSKQDCFFYLELDANKKALSPENFILPYSLKYCNTGHPNVEIRLKKLPFVQVYEITITTDKNALFVWVDAHDIDGYFSDNGFLMITASRKIFFYSNVETNEAELRKQITVRHIGKKESSP